MKKIRAVPPYIHPEFLNFKMPAYQGWVKNGGEVMKSLFPWRPLHWAAFRYELPDICKRKDEVLLMFVEPISIYFDTFPYYATHEIIPFIWDCWPCYYDKMERWLRKHKVKTAVFTSSQEMAEMQRRLPDIRMIHCHEAVDSSLYMEGKQLEDRTIDLLEFGRSNEKVLGKGKIDGINHICTRVNGAFIYNNVELYEAMADAKICICLPKSMTHPDIAQGVETLTQRYWECMLSRTVILGHAPKELVEFIGYNPCVEIDMADPRKQISDILSHIKEYQGLVDKNRKSALAYSDWQQRMKELMSIL